MRLIRSASLALLLTALSGCAWVTLDEGADRIRVALPAQDLSFCAKAGEIAVSVKDRVGVYQRNALKVRDELESMARNEARSLGADTIQPLADPQDGEQRFAAYRCGSAAAPVRDTRDSRPPAQGEAETFPIED